MNIIYNIENNLLLSITKAVELFSTGGVFIYPTDTIYGIGGNPFDKQVRSRIVGLKNRSDAKKFIFLIANTGLINEYANVSEKRINILKKIWPAPVTVILNLKMKYADELNQETAAFRIPANKFCIKLLEQTKLPLISTSVNTEGEPPLTNINSIIKKYSNQVDAVFYSNQETGEIASTIIDITGNEPKLIRQGIINFMDLYQKLI